MHCSCSDLYLCFIPPMLPTSTPSQIWCAFNKHMSLLKTQMPKSHPKPTVRVSRHEVQKSVFLTGLPGNYLYSHPDTILKPGTGGYGDWWWPQEPVSLPLGGWWCQRNRDGKEQGAGGRLAGKRMDRTELVFRAHETQAGKDMRAWKRAWGQELPV